MTLRFALIHATYRRTLGPGEVRDEWLAKADLPNDVEYIVGLDADDLESVRQTQGWVRAVGEPRPGEVTAVRNWNAAARMSTADVLVVIADDLFPPEGWDTSLRRLISPLHPRTTPFAVKVTDDPSAHDRLLRHPVVSRAFFERYGLFGPEFRGVYCDDDVTRRAFWKSFILDGRSVSLDHKHPTLDDSITSSRSQGRINTGDEYEYGLAAYESNWSRYRRRVNIRLVNPKRIRTGRRFEVTRIRLLQIMAAHAESNLRMLHTAARLIGNPHELLTRLRPPT